MTLSARRVRRTTTALIGVTATALTLSGCGADQAGPTGEDGKISVVTSTSVWGSVAQAVGGDDVTTEALISDPQADPHSYETTPRDAAKVGDAQLVVFNGGGYDEFMNQIMSSSGQKAPAVQAFPGESGGAEQGHEHGQEPGHEQAPEHGQEPVHEQAPEHGQEPEQRQGHEAGHEHDHSVNEHVWYDLHVAHETAGRIAEELGKIKPEKAQAFHDSAARFSDRIGALEGRVEQIAAAHQGKQVIVTEPVAHYLIEQAKLRDITPESFVNAVEDGNDPSAESVAEIQNAVTSRQASAVIYNPQTESPVTERVRQTAEQNQIPVVEMTELLPAGSTYEQWMDSQISALDNALNRKP